MEAKADEVRKARCKFFGKCTGGSKSDKTRLVGDSDTHPVFPSVPGGPRFIYDSSVDREGKRHPWVPRSGKELLDACEASMTTGKIDEKWTICASELWGLLEAEAYSCGVAVHLLHRYPFSLLRDVTLDSKFGTLQAGSPETTREKVRMVVENLTRRMPAVWVAVKAQPEYRKFFKRATPPKDPLAEDAPPPTIHLPDIMRLDCDTAYPPDCAGLYVVTERALRARVAHVFGCLRAYAPVRIAGDTGPLDANIVMRLRCAAKDFHFGYRISKDPSQTGDMEFLRVPKGFCLKVNRELQQNNGSCSLLKLLAALVNKYLPGTREDSRYAAADKMLRLLKKESARKGENMDVDEDTPWIFFKNENLSGEDLEFDQANLGKHFWRSLPKLCSHWAMDLSSMEKPKVQEFAKKVVVGFPYGCDLRDAEKTEFMCGWRFRDRAKERSHVQDVHAITPRERSVLEKIMLGRCPAKMDDCTPLYEWLESKGLLHVFDVDELRKVESLGDIVAEFVKIHSRNFQVVSDLKELYQDLQQSRLVLEMAQRDQTCRAKTRKMEEDGQLYARYVRVWEKSLLHPDDMNRYLLVWLRALNLQTAVMTRFNEMTERQINAQAKAARMANIFTRDWNAQLNRAGCNLGSVSSKSYHQSLREGKVCQGKQLPNVMLAMIASLQENREKGIGRAVSAYKDFMEEAKMEPREVGLPTSLDGDATPRHSAALDASPNPHCSAGGQSTCRKEDEEDEGGDGRLALARLGGDTLYRNLKMHEAASGKPVAPACDYRTLQHWEKESAKSLLRIDARHIDLDGLKKFMLPGESLYPGEDVVRFGKGSSPSNSAVTALEICDPTNIYVDVRDCREVLFALLTLLKNNSPQEHGSAVVTFTTSLVNALDLIFQLSRKGRTEMFALIRKRLQRPALEQSGVHHLELGAWKLFLSSVAYLNSNSDQRLNELFRIRYHRHGDPSGVVVSSSGYDESYPARAGSTLAVCEVLETKADPTGLPLQCSPKVLVQESHGQLFRDQRALVERTRKTFVKEVSSLKRRKGSPTLIEMREEVPVKKLHVGLLAENPCESSGPETDVRVRNVPLAAVLHPEGESMRSFDSRPMHMMTRIEELREYDREVNDFRRKKCSICLEAFSNRPLEGFNCVYRDAERKYRLERGIAAGVSILEDSKAYRDYLEYVAGLAAESGNQCREDVETNGMHLFHKSCIRRHIQLGALDLRSPAILCPCCRETIYDQTEKTTLLSNLNDVACRLLLNLDDQLLANRCDDEIIDLKKPGVWESKLVPKEADMKDFKQYLHLEGNQEVDGALRKKYEEHLVDYLRLQTDKLEDLGSVFAKACSPQASDDLGTKARAVLDAGLTQCTALA